MARWVFIVLLCSVHSFAVSGKVAAQSQEVPVVQSSVGSAMDCSKIQIDFKDDSSLTRDEKIMLMDEVFFESVSRFEACMDQNKQNASGSSGASSGTDAGGQESMASSLISGTESKNKPDTSTEASLASEVEEKLQGDEQIAGGLGNGKLPEDIPSADNDSVLEAQIRRAALDEKDPAIRARLWSEYRKYKGLPEAESYKVLYGSREGRGEMLIKMFINKTVALTAAFAFVLSGCVTTGSSTAGIEVGPESSSSILDFFKKKEEDDGTPKPKLDIIIPVFDPGLPGNTANYEEEGIWPELRRAEAYRFAHKMKVALENTGAFGAVRVTPDKTATGDLYILGKIDESDGSEVDIDMTVVDISGERWFNKSFDHTVPDGFYVNARNDGQDPYDPLFEKAANYLVQKLQGHGNKELTDLKSITDLRFATSFSDDAFAQYLAQNRGRVKLVSLPSDDDSMLKRVKAMRVRDQLFVDGMQQRYELFSQKMNDSYLIWQEQSFEEVKAEEEANNKAVGEAILGILVVGLAVAAAVAGANSDSYGGAQLGATGAVVAGAVGANMLSNSFQTSEEAKVHRDALAELGQSIDEELSPQVVEFEDKTIELTGNAEEQFTQWRAFLKKIYLQESTPEMAL